MKSQKRSFLGALEKSNSQKQLHLFQVLAEETWWEIYLRDLHNVNCITQILLFQNRFLQQKWKKTILKNWTLIFL